MGYCMDYLPGKKLISPKNKIEKGIDIKNRYLNVNHKYPFPATLSRAWIALHFLEGTKMVDLVGRNMT